MLNEFWIHHGPTMTSHTPKLNKCLLNEWVNTPLSRKWIQLIQICYLLAWWIRIHQKQYKYKCMEWDNNIIVWDVALGSLMISLLFMGQFWLIIFPFIGKGSWMYIWNTHPPFLWDFSLCQLSKTTASSVAIRQATRWQILMQKNSGIHLNCWYSEKKYFIVLFILLAAVCTLCK